MTEKRYFDNPYEDFKPSTGVLDFTGDALKPEVKNRLLKDLKRLLAQFDDNVLAHIDPQDYSVYTGSAGYALLYLHLSLVFNDHKLLDKSLAYIEPLTEKLNANKLTFICGDSGVLTINAYIHYLKVNQSECNVALKSLKSMARFCTDFSNDVSDELMYGRSGYLYSLLFVRNFIHISNQIIEDNDIRAVVEAIIKSGKRVAQKENMSQKCPLLYYWRQKVYIGAAHGLMGIMALLLEAKQYLTDEELNTCVKPTIDYILSLRFPSGNFSSSLGNKSDRLVHWCHGSPGAVNLFALAYDVFKDEKYLTTTKECGEVVWRKGLLVKGYGICHGAAGNGYAFLRLFRLTKEEKYAYRAVKFGQWCRHYGDHGCRTPDKPYSLFEGMAGTLYFLADLLRPTNARFPGYQLS